MIFENVQFVFLKLRVVIQQRRIYDNATTLTARH